MQAGRVHREEGQDRAGGDPAAAAGGVGATDRHLPHRAGAPRPGRRDRRPIARAGVGPRGGRGRGGRRVRRRAVRHRGGFGLPRRQLRGAGAPVLPQGPVGDVRAGRQAGPGRHLQRRLGAGRAAARPRLPRRAARPHPAAAARRRRGRGLGDRVVGELAACGHRPAPPRHGGPAALRGDGVHLPGRGTPHRGHRGRRGRGVRRLARQPAALGRVRAAAGGVLRRGRAAGHGGRVHRAAAARPPGRGRRAGRRVRGQRRPGDRRGRRPGPQAAPQRGDPGGGGEAGGGGRAADAGAVAAFDRGPYRVLAGLAPPLRPGVGVGPEDRRPARPVLHGGVHRRGQHRPIRGGPAHRRGVGPRVVDGPQPAHRPEEAQRRDRDGGQRVRRARRGEGLGRRHRGGRRRHPGGDLHRQPAGGDLDPVRGRRRDRVPLRLGHLRGAVLQVHPLWRVGGGAPDRGA